MKDEKKVPAIRFKGFTDAWEQRKLEKLGKFFKGKGYSKSDLTPQGTPIILYGNLYTNYQFSIQNVSTFTQLKENSVISKGHEIIFPASGETAEDIARASAVKKQGIILGGDLNIMIPNPEIESEFLALEISNNKIKKALAQKAQGKSVVHIHNTDIQSLNILLTKTSEQIKIIDIFLNLDNLITLHQRKYDCLVKLKKSLLEKMFPKNGSDKPDIRFKGFTDAWEQRKFSELYKKVSEKNDLSYDVDKIISVANMYFKQESYISNKEYLLTYNIFLVGDIAFEGNRSKNFSYGRFVENTIGNGIVSHVFDVFRPLNEYDLCYWKYAINNENIMKNILARCTKSSTMMTNLVANDFLKETIKVPVLNEQKQIGQLFSKIEQLLTLHQRKLEILQNLKKSLLEKMFV